MFFFFMVLVLQCQWLFMPDVDRMTIGDIQTRFFLRDHGWQVGCQDIADFLGN